MNNKELKKIRLQLGVERPEFARLLNTPYSTYVHWECGERRIPGVVEVALVAIRAGIEKERSGKKGGAE